MVQGGIGLAEVRAIDKMTEALDEALRLTRQFEAHEAELLDSECAQIYQAMQALCSALNQVLTRLEI